ncbi:class II glutamine amidotransferase [bacterium]|nr:class II glutamine amidotransferase [bacterium]
MNKRYWVLICLIIFGVFSGTCSAGEDDRENCRIFAAIADPFYNTDRIVELLERFSYPTRPQSNGWSLSCYNDINKKGLLAIPGFPMVVRSNIPIVFDHDVFSSTIDLVTRESPEVILGHLRNSTSGCFYVADPHPFLRKFNGKWYTFMHNGGIWGEDLDRLKELVGNWSQPINCPESPIDSEYLFLYVLKVMEKMGYSGFEALDYCISNLHEILGFRWNAMNIIMSDGETVWGVRSRRGTAGFRLHYHSVDLELSGYVLTTDRICPNAIYMSNHTVIELKPHQVPLIQPLSSQNNSGSKRYE